MLQFPSGRIEICKLRIPVQNLPPHLEGLRLVQLSDFHFGMDSRSAVLLKETVEIVKRLQPDLICYTGDFINGQTVAIDSLCHSLKTIQGRYGSVAVLGNHDHFERDSAAVVTHALEQSQIQVLKNQVSYPMGSGLAIVGLQCLLAHHDLTLCDPDRVIATIPEGIPKVVLAHCPRYSELIARWKIDLQLSGHTHGGQLSLPWIGPLIPKFWEGFNAIPRPLQNRLIRVLPRRIMHNQDCRYIRGIYRQNQGYLYVNRGLGSHFPGRLFCRPEITVITLIAVGLSNQDSDESVDERVLSEIKT